MIKSLILWVLMALSSVASAQVHLEAGQSYSFQFSNVPFSFVCPNCSVVVGSSTWRAAGDLFDNGELFRVDLFEDTPAGAAQASVIYGGGGAQPAELFLGQAGLWSDLNGAARLTVLSGSVDLVSLSLWVVNGDGNAYETTIGATAAVPEPSTALLLFTGTAFCAAWGRRKRAAGRQQ